MAKSKEQAVMVTTEHKGVFFGYLDADADQTTKTIRLTKARLCIYWSADVKGFMGLAATGPTKGCKIGPQAPAITLQGVTSVVEVSPEAIAKWEAGPWCN